MSVIMPISRTEKTKYSQKTENVKQEDQDEFVETKPIYTIPYINYKIDKASFYYYMVMIIVICLTWYMVGIFKYIQKQPNLLIVFIGIIIFCFREMISYDLSIYSTAIESTTVQIVEQMSGVMIGIVVLFVVFNKFNIDKTIQYMLLLSILSLCIPNFHWNIKRDKFGLSNLRLKKQIFLLYGIVMFMTSIILIITNISN